MGANKPIEDIEATVLAAMKLALRGAFASRLYARFLSNECKGLPRPEKARRCQD